jgi:hypothetical protein
MNTQFVWETLTGIQKQNSSFSLYIFITVVYKLLTARKMFQVPPIRFFGITWEKKGL